MLSVAHPVLSQSLSLDRESIYAVGDCVSWNHIAVSRHKKIEEEQEIILEQSGNVAVSAVILGVLEGNYQVRVQKVNVQSDYNGSLPFMLGAELLIPAREVSPCFRHSLFNGVAASAVPTMNRPLKAASSDSSIYINPELN